MQALALSFAYVLPLLCSASPNPGPRADVRTTSSTAGLISPEVSAYAQGLIDNSLALGLTLSVVRLNNNSVTTDFCSWGNRTEDGDPAQPDTLFAIASVSKAFLTSALGILMDDFAHGRNVTALPHGVSEFTFDTKLEALLPNVWKLEDDFASQKSNFRDLLSHVTGLTRNEFMYTRTDTPLSLGERFKYIHSGYELREQWSYSNLMYLFLPHVITTYSSKTFQEFVTERIFVPLDMTATTYNLTVADDSGLMSQSFIFTGRRIPIIFQDPTAANFIAGAGGVMSNAIDMAKWAATVLNHGYGNITFCAPGDNSTTYCAGALADWAAISANGSVDPHALYATTPRITTHAMMWHVCMTTTDSGDQDKGSAASFLLTLQSIYPQGFGRDTTPFLEDTSSLFEFPETDVQCLLDGQGNVKGCGWMDLEPGHERTGSVQERADVWWDKI
ncbi:beta-lactamase/transpeptidase-like protein [Lentinus brumalis]|uniref:Beta-lactamase/transpeptidase-like protein n=1 Tax=Lentinus brumalis TaxID=2498619 RepID=A0A371CL03_9APHY|nr:beta-lactamase/transpeptidase-like protein [Polyporus brumalis]